MAAQAAEDFSRLGEAPHMGITGGEIAIRYREARILLDREHEFRYRFTEPASQEMRLAYYGGRRANPGARAEP